MAQDENGKVDSVMKSRSDRRKTRLIRVNRPEPCASASRWRATATGGYQYNIIVLDMGRTKKHYMKD